MDSPTAFIPFFGTVARPQPRVLHVFPFPVFLLLFPFLRFIPISRFALNGGRYFSFKVPLSRLCIKECVFVSVPHVCLPCKDGWIRCELVGAGQSIIVESNVHQENAADRKKTLKMHWYRVWMLRTQIARSSWFYWSRRVDLSRHLREAVLTIRINLALALPSDTFELQVISRTHMFIQSRPSHCHCWGHGRYPTKHPLA